MSKLLFVDDEKQHESLIKVCFRQEIKNNIYDIAFAKNGEEALKIIAENKPDLLLTDLRVPEKEMDGFELIRQLKRRQIHLKTVVVSAYSGLENITESVKYDVLCFVAKPFDLQALKNLINLLLTKETGVSPQKEDLKTDSVPSRPLTLTKAARYLPGPEKLKLIDNIIETLSPKELLQLQETLPDKLVAQIQIASERKSTVEILREKQKQGLISEEILLDNFLRIIKRSMRNNGVEYGPYYYIVWRDKNGRSTSKCVGPVDPRTL